MNNNSITYKHSGNSGDIIYSLAGIKNIFETQGYQADYKLWLDRKGYYYDGATHPLGDVILNDYMYDRLKPLLESQEYINSVSKFEGETIQVDLDKIRINPVNMPYGHIARWYFYVFPDMACDLSKPWIRVPKIAGFENTIILNRTERYRNPFISYAFLRYYENVAFVGTVKEYELMLKEVPNLTHIDFPDFYELACAINSCKVFIGNQSMCFGLAEAMKVPRILELCNFAPNVIPEGEGPGYDYYSQAGFEHYVKELAGPRMMTTPKSPRLNVEEQLLQYVSKEVLFKVANHTLVDYPRLLKIVEYVKQTEGLEGDIAEVGVYRGGTAKLIRSISRKTLSLFDTFEGMPMVSEHDLHHAGDFADTSVETVIDLLGMATLPDESNVKDSSRLYSHYTAKTYEGLTTIVKGEFPDPKWNDTQSAKEYKLSLVHIDVDIYQSVKDCLEFFYPRMVKGGIIIVDDYNEINCPGAKKAFDEFMADKVEHDYMDCQSQRAFVKL